VKVGAGFAFIAKEEAVEAVLAVRRAFLGASCLGVVSEGNLHPVIET
jgi:hypothetical protein